MLVALSFGEVDGLGLQMRVLPRSNSVTLVFILPFMPGQEERRIA